MVEVKKLLTKEEELNKRKKRNLWIAIILVLIMVGSSAGYAINNLTSNGNSENSNLVKYNGIQFVKDQNGNWQFQYGGKTFIVRYNPTELNDTKVVTGSFISDYQAKPLYIIGGLEGGSYEIAQNLNGIPLRISPGCYDKNCSFDYHIVDCSSEQGIIFQEPLKSEKERAYKEGDCVFLVSNSTNQVKFADAFLYNLLGI